MIHRHALLSDLQSLLRSLEADLLERSEATDAPAEIGEYLQAEHKKARSAGRTAQNFEDWRSDFITQVAAAWVLSCVFARFLEDNQLIDPPKLAGPGQRLLRARDEHEVYFRAHPSETDREYLIHIFGALAKLPGAKEIFGEHNPINELPNWLSGDAAGELLRFFQKIDANTGELVHDFTDADWNTRFLGDLYQDLSEAARKKYALLQTPEFVEQFILDRTLDPALDDFGVDARAILNDDGEEVCPAGFRMIDPACGSGHFLLGAFDRILERWRRKEPAAKDRELVQRALDSIHGVDLNPFAVAIARFRLLIAALRESNISRLRDAPDFTIHLSAGDALLHGPPVDARVMQTDLFGLLNHHSPIEDAASLKASLAGNQYHAVVANPPYITVKDKAVSAVYREGFGACHRKYSVAVPFKQRMFDLAVPAGYIGMITANSFMKREFGSKLIEQYIPRWDLTHVIDTSGAYIPGHGTPTVILFLRKRKPVASTVRTAMGIRGEPSTPNNPAKGLVWTDIVRGLDQAGRETDYVSIDDTDRRLFHTHPWTLSGGGAAQLKEQLDANAIEQLDALTDSIGVMVVTLEDEAFAADSDTQRRARIGSDQTTGFVEGDRARDWSLERVVDAIFPYTGNDLEPELAVSVLHRLWPYRAGLQQRLMFRKTQLERGAAWYEYGMFIRYKYRSQLSITFGEVTTHNHFVLDRGGKVFKQTAPVLKLPKDATEDDHLALLGLLNSSVVLFFLKNSAHNKGDSTDDKGARTTGDVAFNTYAFNSTLIKKTPLPAGRSTNMARRLDALAMERAACLPGALVGQETPRRDSLDTARQQAESIRAAMIALQEELDWQCYGLYGLLEGDDLHAALALPMPESGEGTLVSEEETGVLRKEIDVLAAQTRVSAAHTHVSGKKTGVLSAQTSVSGTPTDGSLEKTGVSGAKTSVLAAEAMEAVPPVALGQRAFEIVLARRVAAGETTTTWFKRHGSTPITEIPEHWPADYRAVVEKRIELIEKNKSIRLIEKPEFKRRWNDEPWAKQEERALRRWLLRRLEQYFDLDGRMTPGSESKTRRKFDVAVVSTAKLADAARSDAEFMQVGEVYRDDKAFDVQTLIDELVADESVPMLPVLRYKATGLRKRLQWEKTWDLQRAEDAIDARTKLAEDDPQHLTQKQAERSKKEEIGDIPVPPKYKSSDFQKSSYWRLRGKLDVPKERWVSFPHCEGEDGTLPIAWAGYDHLQLAKAISAYYVDVQERMGGTDDPRLIPLLACMLELLPWLKQWHNEIDPEFNVSMSEYFEGFVQDEARKLDMTLNDIRAWEPPQGQSRRHKRKTVSKGAKSDG